MPATSQLVSKRDGFQEKRKRKTKQKSLNSNLKDDWESFCSEKVHKL